MRNHRRKCGVVDAKENGIDRDIIPSPVANTVTTNTIVWSPEQYETIVEESGDKDNQTVVEIINGDIRHRKSSSKKRRRLSVEDSNSIDVSLSKFLISCGLSFDVILNNQHFKEFMSKVNRDYTVPTSNQLKTTVLNQLDSRSSKKRRKYETSDSDSE